MWLKTYRFVHANGLVKRFWFLICFFFLFILRTGTDCHSNIRAHRIRHSIHHSNYQRTQTSVSYRLDVHFVSVFVVRSIRIPEKEVASDRYV